MGFLTVLRTSSLWLTTRLNLRSEAGATAVEYGLMIALIAAVIVGAVAVLGQQTGNAFTCTANAVKNKTAC